MFEVIEHGNGFAWQMICATGRVLYGPFPGFPCIGSAADAAKAYRVAFWRVADRVDHRMARCF